MSIVTIILLCLEGVVSLLLVGLVLLQKSQGGGLGMAFGGAAGDTLFGSRTGNVLTKATIILGIIFLLNTVFLAMMFSNNRQRSLMERKGGGAAAVVPQQQAPAETFPVQ